MTSEHEQLATELRGEFFNTVRDRIFSLDWDGLYPEVDVNGCLTGEVIDAQSADHAICDITADDVVVSEHASDAMIKWDSERGDIYAS